MSKSVVINLGHGDLNNGFERVTAQLWVAGHPLPEQFIGSLPAAPALVEQYRSWQLIYQTICNRKQLRSSEEEDDELEFAQGGITNVSVVRFEELGRNLHNSINAWLKSQEFLNIDQQLRSRLLPSEEIRVIIEANDILLRQLPWHRWKFFQDYLLAEVALSRPEYKRTCSLPLKVPTNKVRILAILSNSKGIDLEAETRVLQSLQDAEVYFLVNPSRTEFNTQLWHKAGWDILFFAGHSQTEGETGRIYINDNQTNNSLTIEQLEEALKSAIENGLKLAIFNSCDGMGLAIALEKLNIPTVIVMREPVPNRVAQDFFKHFLAAFAGERLPLYLSVQQARRKLQGVEDDFPGASWLPVICQNPAVEPQTWLCLGGIPPCPYRGLFAFREEDAHLFFGREQLTWDLVAAVKRKPLVAVVGPSGSGKSSVVFAGLIPKLRQGAQGISPPNIVSFRPGNNPIEALAVALAPFWQHSHLQRRAGGEEESVLVGVESSPASPASPASPCKSLAIAPDENARHLVELELAIALRQDNLALYKIIETLVQQNSGTRLVLIADQFEELYTQTPEPEQQHFLDALLNACSCAPGFTLVLTLRADFYGHALSYRPFSDALQWAVHNLGPMSREELQSVIEEPAALMQVRLEEGLTNRLINAAWGHSGRLPLLEFALATLWSKHQSGWLTKAAYEEIGGVEEALANHAESVYAQLSEADRCRAQRVFIQLVQPGFGMDANRRLATRDEVKQENWDLVTRLASARLVVTNRNESTEEETVEIVHEALIRSWGRLGYWIRVDGEFRRWQEQLRAAIHQWESTSKDEGALLRGKPLADAEDWQIKRLLELSSTEQVFIQLSLERRDRKIKKEKRRLVILRSLLGGVSVALVGAVGVGMVAVGQWRRAEKVQESQINALSGYSNLLGDSNQVFDALIEDIRVGRQLTKQKVSPRTRSRVVAGLRQAIYKVKERNRLVGHSNWVESVSFSPDGKTIATASHDKTVKFWSRDGQLLKTLTGHNERVNRVVFSPDGKTIATASTDKTVKLWSLDGRLLHTLAGHKGDIWGVSFSPDGRLLATASNDMTVKLWSKEGQLLRTITAAHNPEFGTVSWVRSVSFSPDGKTIATASRDKTIKLWSLDGRLLHTLTGHSDWVDSLSFSPDGKTIASASNDKTIKLWSIDGKELHTLTGHDGFVSSVSFSPDGKTIASASKDKTVKLWSIDGQLLDTLTGHDDFVESATFSPDGKTLASASQDKTVKLWSLDSQELHTFTGHGDGVNSVSFSPDGKTIASASEDKTVKLWSRDGQLLHTLQGHNSPVTRVVFSSDGQLLATASTDKTAKLWSRDGQLLHTLQGHKSIVWGLSFSPDGKTIASASEDKTVKLWSLEGKLLHTLKGHTDGLKSVSFSPDGKTIASASDDKTVKLWSPNGQLLRTLTGYNDWVRSVVFSPEGKTIASASDDKTVKLWSIDGQLLRTFQGHKDELRSVSFSPDGKIIASASMDKTIKLWSLDGQELQTLIGHKDGVTSVSFSPDGKTIASSSWDKSMMLRKVDLEKWEMLSKLDLDELLVHACSWVRDYLKTNASVSESDRHLCDRISIPK
jgi:WD40 repeat protein